MKADEILARINVIEAAAADRPLDGEGFVWLTAAEVTHLNCTALGEIVYRGPNGYRRDQLASIIEAARQEACMDPIARAVARKLTP